jgi:hypothetical protein
MDRPLTYGGAPYYAVEDRTSTGRGRRWAIAFVFFCAFAGLLGALVLFQLTSEGVSERTLRRATAALTEVDVLVARNYDALQAEAEAAPPGSRVTLPDYPIDVALTREDVLGRSPDEVRDLVLDRSAARLYEDGTAALRERAEAQGDVATFSVGGLTDRWLGFHRERNYDVMLIVVVAMSAACAALAAVLAISSRGFGRLASVGAVVLAASLPWLLFGVAVRLFTAAAGGDGAEYIDRELLAIGEELALIPIRIGAAFAVLGLVLLVAGLLLSAWSDRREAAGQFIVR